MPKTVPRSRKTFLEFSDADLKRLRAEFGVPSHQLTEFIQATERSVINYDLLCQYKVASNPGQVRKYLKNIAASSNQLITSAKPILGQFSVSRISVALLVRALIHQAVPIPPKSEPAYRDSKKTELGGSPPNAALLLKAQPLLSRMTIDGPMEAEGDAEQFIGLLLALNEAAEKLQKDRIWRSVGRPPNEANNWLSKELAEIFRKHSSINLMTESRDLFTKYMQLCFSAAGKEFKDLGPLVRHALGKQTGQQRRLLQEEEDAIKNTPQTAWPRRRSAK